MNITNLLPQNGIVSIADSGSTAYGLIRTPDFNELTAYNRNQINNPDFFDPNAPVSSSTVAGAAASIPSF